MNERVAAPTYKRHRFPPAIIGHTVWLYCRFALSYRDVEELLAERGVIVTDETIRRWCRTFGQQYANALRRRRPQPGDTWHLDAVFVSIKASSTTAGGPSIRTASCAISSCRRGATNGRRPSSCASC